MPASWLPGLPFRASGLLLYRVFSERGIKDAHGYLTEYVVEPERYLTPVPPDLRDIAVLAEPLTIAEKAPCRSSG